ncbi:hypothetical protein ACLMJK_004561 [Lecanora helva]
MTRAQQTISLALLASSFPFWAIVSFGAYLLGKLGWGVLVFNNVPDAYDELMGEIAMAKKDLKGKGISID